MKKAPETGTHHLRPEGEVSVCPQCGYTDGFHVSFHMAENRTEGEIVLICPDCHHRFRLGWTVNLASS